MNNAPAHAFFIAGCLGVGMLIGRIVLRRMAHTLSDGAVHQLSGIDPGTTWCCQTPVERLPPGDRVTTAGRPTCKGR